MLFDLTMHILMGQAVEEVDWTVEELDQVVEGIGQATR